MLTNSISIVPQHPCIPTEPPVSWHHKLSATSASLRSPGITSTRAYDAQARYPPPVAGRAGCVSEPLQSWLPPRAVALAPRRMACALPTPDCHPLGPNQIAPLPQLYVLCRGAVHLQADRGRDQHLLSFCLRLRIPRKQRFLLRCFYISCCCCYCYLALVARHTWNTCK